MPGEVVEAGELSEAAADLELAGEDLAEFVTGEDADQAEAAMWEVLQLLAASVGEEEGIYGASG